MGGGKCPSIVFLEGANIHHYAFVEGAISLPCLMLGGQMSTHAIFHRGADVRGGGGMSGSRLEHQGSLELVRRSRQFPYTFNVKIHPWLEQRWLELSN